MIAGLSNVGSLEGEINLAKCLELALHDGYDPIAHAQVGRTLSFDQTYVAEIARGLNAPLTAAPQKIAPEPVLAPPPVPVRPATMPTIIEVPVEVEIAATADPSPAATPAEPKPEPKSASQPHRRGLFRHR